jgi:predicted transcriptional regulator
MANTLSRPFSVRLKPSIRKKLGKLAERTGRSSNFLVGEAIEIYLSDQERMLADIRRGERQMDAGHYVRNEDVKAWLLSWGTEHELPPPRCVCGKCHDGKSL